MNDYRFPTTTDYLIPVLPEGDIFDTIPGAQEIEAIVSRPAWDFAEADARLRPAVQKALDEKANDRTKTTATPKRRPNRKVNP